MEVIIPSPNMEFDFNSARSSPYMSAPSTPKRFGEVYFSAPTTPSRMSEFYREFDEFSNSSSSIPFGWEEKPGTPKSPKLRNPKPEQEDEDFAFDFSEDLERTSLSAEELFDGGKIKPLKPPPRLQQLRGRAKTEDAVSSPRQRFNFSPKTPIKQGKRIISEAFSPRRKKEKDPFKVAMQNSCEETENVRGRDRNLSSNSGRRATRSLSPYRVSAYPWEEEERKQTQNSNTQNNSKQSFFTSKPSFSSSSSKGSRKWRLKDFLLFRSKSDGRAIDADPFRRYSGIFKKQEDMKNSTSFRSNDGSVSRRKGGPLSAHELHYTVNKAVSQDLKKKTFLPYKQGILGRLAFNPAVNALANGFGSLSR